MAKVDTQTIPSEDRKNYEGVLQPATTIFEKDYVRGRYPWRIPKMQDGGASPSPAQQEVRKAFKKCVDCFNVQPYSGGATPPDLGPRNRSWWYAAAAGSGLWYYDYFIQQTWAPFYEDTPPDWCKVFGGGDSYVKSDYPDDNEGGREFLSLYVNSSSGHPKWRVYIKNRYPGQTEHLALYFYYIYQAGAGDYVVEVWGVDDDTWEEGSITWNNAPAPVQLLDSAPVAEGAWSTFYIGDYASVCLKINPEHLPEHSPYNIYNAIARSKDYPDPASRPYFY